MMQIRAFTITAQPIGDRRVRFVCSTKAVDRHGTRFHPQGCRHANFDRNPVFLWNHNKEGDPDDVIGRVIELQITDDAVTATVEFDTGKKAQKCLRRVRRGVLRAVSIGFVSIREMPPDSEGVIDVLEWELCELSLVPVGSNPEALAIRSFTVRSGFHSARTRSARTPSIRTISNNDRGYMDPKAILEKLGLAEGAKPEEIAAALLKYLTGSDPDADKLALIVGLLSMLAPASSSSSASDGGEEAARDAMVEEVRRLETRLAELEGQKDAAEKRAEPTPEERADKACKAGQWPMGQRSALVDQFKAGKAPYLFPEKTFSTRGIRFTDGGNPVQTEAKTAPNFGSDAPALNSIDKLVLGIAKRSGINLTPEKFAAQRAAGK